MGIEIARAMVEERSEDLTRSGITLYTTEGAYAGKGPGTVGEHALRSREHLNVALRVAHDRPCIVDRGIWDVNASNSNRKYKT